MIAFYCTLGSKIRYVCSICHLSMEILCFLVCSYYHSTRQSLHTVDAPFKCLSNPSFLPHTSTDSIVQFFSPGKLNTSVVWEHGALPRWLHGKESACHRRRLRFDPCIRMIPWRKKWQPTSVFLPKFPGQRCLVGGLWPMRTQRAGYNWVTEHKT